MDRFVCREPPPQPPSDNTTTLLDKYRPAHSDGVVAASSVRDRVRQWVLCYRDKRPGTKKALLLAGPCGIGKSLLARLVLAECGFVPTEVTASSLNAKKNMGAFLAEFGRNAHVLGHAKALVVDEVDSFNAVDNGGIAELVAFVSPLRSNRRATKNMKDAHDASYWPLPVVCTCNSQAVARGRVADLSKDCEVVAMHTPSNAQLTEYFRGIVAAEGLGVCARDLDAIVSAAQGDVRQVFASLELSRQLGAPVHVSRKDPSHDASTATALLLHSDDGGCDHALRMFHVDTTVVPLMVFENYVDNAATIHAAATAAHCISTATCLEHQLCKLHRWDLLDAYGVYSTVAPAFAVRSSSATAAIRFGNLWSKLSTASARHAQLVAVANTLVATGIRREQGVEHLAALRQRFMAYVHGGDYQGLVLEAKDSLGLSLHALTLVVKSHVAPKALNQIARAWRQ